MDSLPTVRASHLDNAYSMDTIMAVTESGLRTPDSEDETSDHWQRYHRQASPWIITAAREEFDLPRKDRVNTSTWGSLLIRFRVPAVYRLQIRATSCAVWFPQELCAGFAEAFSFMTSQAPTAPSLALALDASSLLQIGQEHGDERMMIEGKKMYCDALKFLHMALAQPSPEGSDALVGAITVLQVAEANVCMRGADWRNHTAGLLALMRERTKDGRHTHFGWPRLVERNFATFSFWDSLLARRRLDSFLHDDAPALLLIAQAVPGALLDCDEVCHGRFSEERALEVYCRLKDLEAELVDWTMQWNRCMREAPFELVSSASLPFPGRKAPVAKLRDVFPQVFRFRDLADCLDHSMCTASMLALKRAMLDLSLAAASHGCSNAARAEFGSPQALRRSITACADSLCMGFPHLCEPKHGKFGKVVTAPPLSMARDWYSHMRQTTGSRKIARKLAWCRIAAGAIEHDGTRIMT